MPRLTITSLRARILLLFLLILVPLLVISLYAGIRQQRLLVEETENHAISAAENLSLLYESKIREAKTLLSSLSVVPSVRSGNFEDTERILARAGSVDGHYTNLILVNPDGEVVVSGAEIDGNPPVFQDRVWFSRVLLRGI